MEKKMVLSKLVYFAVALSLLTSMVVVGCAKEEAPITPTTPGEQMVPAEPTAPTAPTAPITPTAPTIPPQYGGTFRLADSSLVTICFPPKATTTFDYRHSCPAIDWLFRLDKDLNPQPWLATGYTSDYAAKTITITLRRGVKFSDGTDFNAEAVKWNLEQHKKTAVEGAANLKSIDIIDDYTIRINLNEWDITMFTSLCQSMGGIVSPTAYEKNGEAWAMNNPVGTGAFVLESFQKEVVIKYKKRDGYWQEGKPYLDAIEIYKVVDAVTRELALRNGEFDTALMLNPRATDGLAKDGFIVLRGPTPSGSTNPITPDSANPASPFADIRVRQAVGYALDREAIVESQWPGGGGIALTQIGYPGMFGYNPDVVGYTYNPTRAKELLAEAGYPTGFKTKLEVTSTPGESQSAFIAAQSYLKAVGIDAELDLAATARYVAIGIGGQAWTGLATGYCRSGHPDPLRSQVLSFYQPSALVSMAKPREFMEAVEYALQSPDIETKAKRTQAIMKLMIDKYAMTIPTWTGKSDSSTRYSYVHNLGYMVYSPNAGTWMPEECWMEPR